MQSRDIRHLAVAVDGSIFASDGGRRIDQLDGAWFARWQRLPDQSQIVAINVFNGDVLACDAGNRCIWRVRRGSIDVFAGLPQPRSLVEYPRRIDGPPLEARFAAPNAMTVANGSIFVAERGNTGPLVRLVESGLVSTVEVRGAAEVAIDSLAPAANGAFALGTSDNCPYIINMVRAADHFEARVLAGSRGEFGLDDGQGDNARFVRPSALCPSQGGGCNAADGARLRVVTARGAVTTLAGSAPGFRDGVGSDARFGVIPAIAADGAGSVIVADPDNDALRSAAPDGKVTTVLGGPNSNFLNDSEARSLSRHFARALVDDDVAEAWALARSFLADHAARHHEWPDRSVQPVSLASARIGKELATKWSQAPDTARARLGSYCLWLVLCEERADSVDEFRDSRLLRLGRELLASR